MRAVEFMVRGAMVGGDVVKVLDGLVKWFRMLVALCFALVNMVLLRYQCWEDVVIAVGNKGVFIHLA
jgi:hypothetical protein